LIHKAFYTLCDTVQKVGTFSATYKTIKYQSGIVSKLARYLLGTNQAKIKGHTMKNLMTYIYCTETIQHPVTREAVFIKGCTYTLGEAANISTPLGIDSIQGVTVYARSHNEARRIVETIK
jgi:hypothetical protein